MEIMDVIFQQEHLDRVQSVHRRRRLDHHFQGVDVRVLVRTHARVRVVPEAVVVLVSVLLVPHPTALVLVLVVVVLLVVVLDVRVMPQVGVQLEVLLSERVRVQLSALVGPREVQRQGAARLGLGPCSVGFGLQSRRGESERRVERARIQGRKDGRIPTAFHTSCILRFFRYAQG